MIGVAGVAAHGHAGQLAHKVILQTGADDLPRVVEVFRANEANHRVDQEGLIALGKAVAAGLHGHLVGAVMGLGGQLGALAGFKIEDVGPLAGALAQNELTGLLDGRAVETEGGVALFGAGDGLEDQIRRRACLNGFHLGGHVGQDAGLGGDGVALLDLLKAGQDALDALGGVTGGVEADDRVTCAEAQTLQNRGDNAVGVVGGMVGLQTARQGAGQADSGVAVGGDGHFLGRGDQVQIAHELAHRRHHFRGKAPAHPGDVVAGGGLGQEPFPQVGDGPVADLGVDALVQVILDDAGDLVAFVGGHRVFPQVAEQQVGQHHLGRHPFLGVFRGDTGHFVAGFFLVGLGQHVLYVPKGVGFSEEKCLEDQKINSYLIMYPGKLPDASHRAARRSPA